MSPARRRDAVAFLMRRHDVSQRRACKVVGQYRSTQRYAAVPSDFEARLVKQMREFSERYPRWGYRTIHALLVEDGWQVNRKRVERLWREHELQVRHCTAATARKPAALGRTRPGTCPR